MQTEVKPAWVSYEEAQRFVGLGRTTLWRLASVGEIKTARVGRAVRINVDSLHEYMERASQDALREEEPGSNEKGGGGEKSSV